MLLRFWLWRRLSYRLSCRLQFVRLLFLSLLFHCCPRLFLVRELKLRSRLRLRHMQRLGRLRL